MVVLQHTFVPALLVTGAPAGATAPLVVLIAIASALPPWLAARQRTRT